MYILLLCGFSKFTKFLCILFYILFIRINSLHFYRFPTAQVDFPVTRHGVEGCLDGVHDKRHLRLLGLRDDSYYSTWRQKKNSGARATWIETSAAPCRQSWERLAPAWARPSCSPLALAGVWLVFACGESPTVGSEVGAEIRSVEMSLGNSLLGEAAPLFGFPVSHL